MVSNVAIPRTLSSISLRCCEVSMNADETEDSVLPTEAPCRLPPAVGKEVRLMLARLVVRKWMAALHQSKREGLANDETT